MTEHGATCPIQVRAGDIDANGHVNNTAYADYFQQARTTYFRDLLGEDWGDASVVVATMTIDFAHPVTMADDVSVEVRVVEAGTSSWTVEYTVRAVADDEERVAATGSSVQVAWDRERATSRPLPDGWRDRLEAELVAPEA